MMMGCGLCLPTNRWERGENSCSQRFSLSESNKRCKVKEPGENPSSSILPFPLSMRNRKMAKTFVDTGGIEPPTSCVLNRRDNHYTTRPGKPFPSGELRSPFNRHPSLSANIPPRSVS